MKLITTNRTGGGGADAAPPPRFFECCTLTAEAIKLKLSHFPQLSISKILKFKIENGAFHVKGAMSRP